MVSAFGPEAAGSKLLANKLKAAKMAQAVEKSNDVDKLKAAIAALEGAFGPEGAETKRMNAKLKEVQEFQAERDRIEQQRSREIAKAFAERIEKLKAAHAALVTAFA